MKEHDCYSHFIGKEVESETVKAKSKITQAVKDRPRNQILIFYPSKPTCVHYLEEISPHCGRPLGTHFLTPHGGTFKAAWPGTPSTLLGNWPPVPSKVSDGSCAGPPHRCLVMEPRILNGVPQLPSLG